MIKRIKAIVASIIMILITAPVSGAEWVKISGSVLTENGTSLCTMVLANGQYMFSCDESQGKYEMDVPPDENGQITLFSFSDGFAPFKQTLSSEESNFDIIMMPASSNSQEMTVSVQIGTANGNSEQSVISGTVKYGEIPLTAMLLANGQYMFTDGESGAEYKLTVPIDDENQVTLFVFCDGFQPFKQIIDISLGSKDNNYPIVDTGQTTFYNNSQSIAEPGKGEAFYGQDAHYEGNQPDYTVSADELTVYDKVTGLTWTQGADWNSDGTVDVKDKMSYNDALEYADTLNTRNYGGFKDWRVPTIKELYSLIDYNGTDPNPTANSISGLVPFINDDIFEFAYGDSASGERVIDSQWVTSTFYVSKVMNNSTAMFGVNFADGRIKGYPDGKTHYARFCRGNIDYGLNSFNDNDDDTINDFATGLMWSQEDSGQGMTWEDALSWVQEKNEQAYLGYSDWRMPNAKELQSIVDYTRSPATSGSAAISALFNATQIIDEAGDSNYPFYWSSTTFLRFDGSPARAVYVAFGEGLGSIDGTSVIDVHGAGCQRSDPKDGDPDEFPDWGRGPQGDVQRVFNYVRMVRDADGT